MRPKENERTVNVLLNEGKTFPKVRAIGLKGVLTQISLLGTTDGLTFEAFISQKLVSKLWKGASVVIDNCSGVCHFFEREIGSSRPFK